MFWLKVTQPLKKSVEISISTGQTSDKYISTSSVLTSGMLLWEVIILFRENIFIMYPFPENFLFFPILKLNSIFCVKPWNSSCKTYASSIEIIFPTQHYLYLFSLVWGLFLSIAYSVLPLENQYLQLNFVLELLLLFLKSKPNTTVNYIPTIIRNNQMLIDQTELRSAIINYNFP